MGIMNFLVNEMGYNSLSISGASKVFCYSLKNRIIPRCSVVKILVSKGLIQNKPCINTFITIADKSFVEKFVKKYELQVPELMQYRYNKTRVKDVMKLGKIALSSASTYEEFMAAIAEYLNPLVFEELLERIKVKEEEAKKRQLLADDFSDLLHSIKG
ncbi:hypothetical protein C5167_044940 [Papaver somniferum]|uniref:Uncharacterized protein n=1 Tax=Papaver somniferum TaxID=3469 RepID=A0A4Y7L9E1_PAPSO|nr:hypothetical protein C5167_044940 [Papaver somniferum]